MKTKKIISICIFFVMIITTLLNFNFTGIQHVHAASVNLAAGKTATATDYNSSGESPAQAVDSSLSTHWASTTTGDRWLMVDLGSSVTFNRWVVKNAQTGGEDPDFNTKDFKLQVSSDGTNFTDVDTVTGNTQSITNRQISSTTARYVRLYITAPNQLTGSGSNIVRIREFEIYNDTIPSSSNYYYFDIDNYMKTNSDKFFYPLGSDENTPTGRYVKVGINLPNQDAADENINIAEIGLYYDIALGKTATATDYNSSGESPAQAVDGDLSTHWASTSTGDRWLMVDLGSSNAVSRWIVRNAEAGGESPSYNTKDYKLQVSSDGINFTDVDSVTNNISAITDRTLTSTSGRYFRLYITTPNSVPDNVVRIREFELYDSNDNLLLNSSTIVSTDQATATDSNSSSEGPEKSQDTLVNTHWASTSTGDRWLTVDLGLNKTTPIASWVVRNAEAGGESPTYNTKDYKLQISNDNVNFTDVDTVTGNTAAVTIRSIGATQARYWRLYITTPNQLTGTGSNIVRIPEFELLDSTGTRVYRQEDYSDSTHTPSKAVDGNNSTYWQSTSTGSWGSRWLKVDLGSAKKFNRLVVQNAGAAGLSTNKNAISYSVSVSNDDLYYTGIGGVDRNTANSTDTMFTGKKYTKYAYDFLKMAATLQGLVNRDGPKVFFKYQNNGTSASMNFQPDDYWLSKLTAAGQILNGKTQVVVNDFYTDLLDKFLYKVGGLVLWDENVPSTSNVASTISGVENLLPVRYDTDSSSLYTELMNKNMLDVGVDLTGKFTGTGTIWNSNIASSGSKKNDAYLWAKQKYLDTHKVSSEYVGYAVDAWTSLKDSNNKNMYDDLYNRNLINQDFNILKKSFFVDLSAVSDHLPNDDPGQTVGTDYTTFNSILGALQTYANGTIFTLNGFTPWHLKYTTQVDHENGVGPVDAEWKTSDLVSAHNGQVSTDAPGYVAVANTSLYNQVTLNSSLSQNNDKGVNGMTYDSTKTYIMMYMGDYDNTAWTTTLLPAFWNNGGRGRYPLAWGINPQSSRIVPQVFNYLYSTMSTKDYFVSSTDGSSYMNPQVLSPTDLTNWTTVNTNYFSQLDLQIAGFNVSTTGTIPKSIEEKYATFATKGSFANASSELAVVSGAPFMQMTDLGYGVVAQSKYWVERGLLDYIQNVPGKHFYAYRNVVSDPGMIADGMDQLIADYPSLNIVVLDPYTFLRLYASTLVDTSSLSYGQPATAIDSNSTAEGPSNGNDGNISTHWASTTTGDRWLEYDLGSTKTVNRWVVRNAGANGESTSYNTKDYKLQISSDGTNWTDLDTVTGNTANVTDRNITGTTGRYVRLYITTPNQITGAGSNVVRINQFAVYGN